MATQQLSLVCDNSTSTNYKAWAKPMSDWMRSGGFTNTADTGQLNGNGPGPGGWSGVSTVPASNAYYYEIFQSASGSLTTYYVKLEYGNSNGSTNSPSIRISVGTGTNGSGSLTGQQTSAIIASPTPYTAPSSSTTYECNFSADASSNRMAIMMWRNAPGQQGEMLLAIERSVNSAGIYTSTHVTIWTCGVTGLRPFAQQTVNLSTGAGPQYVNSITTAGGWCTRCVIPNTGTSSAFSNNVPVDLACASIGIFDYPCTVVGYVDPTDITEGMQFSIINQYGNSVNYIASKNSNFGQNQQNSTTANSALMMRFD